MAGACGCVRFPLADPKDWRRGWQVAEISGKKLGLGKVKRGACGSWERFRATDWLSVHLDDSLLMVLIKRTASIVHFSVVAHGGF